MHGGKNKTMHGGKNKTMHGGKWGFVSTMSF
jgi:hypothetical protein